MAAKKSTKPAAPATPKAAASDAPSTKRAPVRPETPKGTASAENRMVAHFLSATTNLIFVYDLVSRSFVSVNHAVTDCLGYTPDEVKLMGTKAIERLVHPEDAGRLQEHYESCALSADGDILQVEYRMKHAFGDWHWLSSSDTVYERSAEGNALQVLSVADDTTDRRMVQEKLSFVSTHDGLTGLYNRAYYQEEMKRLERGRHFPVTVLVADIDGLRQINEARGPAAGDAAIRHAAEIIQSCFRAEDMVARIGEDEFGAFLPDVNATSGEAILARLNRKIDLFNQAHPGTPLHLSLGTATADEAGMLAEAAREADRRVSVKKAMTGGKPAG